MKREKITSIAITAMFAAMITVTTMFVSIKLSANGYVHLGDTLIYLAACFLPTPYAIAAASIGAGLADLMAGYPHFIIFTIIIKAANASLFSSKKNRLLTTRNSLMLIPSGLITIAGYSAAEFVLELVLYHNGTAQSFALALSKIPENAGQAAASGVLFLLAAAALDASKAKKTLDKLIRK
ncbi:MAG: ECF transporter S component [Oscillospiraceae bacterium]|jgi:uncharacterized repeat protein (TIGR04002 family)|nr:ECF transporter S component [Oscillospiraceae bacterium]